MTASQALAFLLFAVVAAITPGPSNLILTSTGAKVGLLRGLPCLGGVVIGMGLMMFLVAFGLGNVVLASPWVILLLKWAGTGFLLWLSWKIATAGRSDVTTAKQPLGFWGAAAFQWINPKSWLACTSAAATFLDQGRGSAPLQAAVLALLFVAAALPCCFVWLAFGAVVQRALRSERALRTFNIVMGALLAASVVLLIR